MRDHNGHLSFRPQLAPGWRKLAFRLMWQGARIHVQITGDEVVYTAIEAGDDGVEIRHGDETLHLDPGTPVTRAVKRVDPMTPRPTQPVGRAPLDSRTLDQG